MYDTTGSVATIQWFIQLRYLHGASFLRERSVYFISNSPFLYAQKKYSISTIYLLESPEYRYSTVLVSLLVRLFLRNSLVNFWYSYRYYSL